MVGLVVRWVGLVLRICLSCRVVVFGMPVAVWFGFWLPELFWWCL